MKTHDNEVHRMHAGQRQPAAVAQRLPAMSMDDFGGEIDAPATLGGTGGDLEHGSYLGQVEMVVAADPRLHINPVGHVAPGGRGFVNARQLGFEDSGAQPAGVAAVQRDLADGRDRRPLLRTPPSPLGFGG